jgi:hypothetical protein
MSKNIEQLKNLASGYEGSRAVLALNHELAREVLTVVKADEQSIVDGLSKNPATITGNDLCEMVRRLQEPPLEVFAEVAPVPESATDPTIDQVAEAVAAIEANTPVTPPLDPQPIPAVKPQGKHHRK